MAMIVRPTSMRDCDLCREPPGPDAIIYEIFDDRVESHRMSLVCKRHLTALHEALPLALRGGSADG